MACSTVSLAALLVAGCQNQGKLPDPAPSAQGSSLGSGPAASAPVALAPGTGKDLTKAVGAAWRAAIADLDGDGDREIVVVDSKAIRVLDPSGREVTSAPVPGGILSLVAADLDGDKRDEIYAGWGQTRDHMKAPARVTAYRMERGALVEDVVLAPETTRPEVVALVPMPDTQGLLVAYFDSKYTVTSMAMTRGGNGWSGTKLASLRTATTYARGDVDGDGAPDVVVGRVYGDDRGLDGDAFVLRPDGSRTPIPSTRGLRSLALADGDGDGTLDVFMGDGWHQNYGQHARGRLSWSRYRGGAFVTELIEETRGQYEIMRILPAQIDGALALVTLGNQYVRVFVRSGDAWRGTTIARAARDIAVGELDGTPGDEILVVGDTSQIIELDRARKGAREMRGPISPSR